ncbi:MAG: hypothetical protein EOP04_12575 [Proteobacteria bacterium]|nr:MAG: hypothetical protein EOP04_12575 [Pseudomonadota bacterium]
MPSASALFRYNNNSDSVLVTSSVVPLDLIPKQIDSVTMIVKSADSVCMDVQENFYDDGRHYLIVKEFKRTDTGYYVQVASLSCGKYASGGQLGVYLKKIGDSVVVTESFGSSIN